MDQQVRRLSYYYITRAGELIRAALDAHGRASDGYNRALLDRAVACLDNAIEAEDRRDAVAHALRIREAEYSEGRGQ
jgi:hypothetical protein